MRDYKFPIYICEDNPKQRDWLTNLIQRYVMIEDYPMEVVCSTGDPHKLLAQWTNRDEQAIFFLDIDLQQDLSGMDLARQIRSYNDIAKIIFVTTKQDYLPLSLRYKIQALDFIPKDNLDTMTQLIKDCLDTIKERVTLNGGAKQLFSFKLGRQIVSLPYSQILYIATTPQVHMLELVVDHGRYQFYQSMKEIVKEIQLPLIPVSRSEVVNLDKVVCYNPVLRNLTVVGNHTLNISQRQYSQVVRALKERQIPTE